MLTNIIFILNKKKGALDMSNKKTIKKVARNVKNTKRAQTKKRTYIFKRIWNGIRGICRTIKNFLVRIWGWICKLNFIALLNCTLLVAIIVLFSMLIMDMLGCNKQTVVIVEKPKTVTEQVVVTEKDAPKSIVLPLQKKVAEPVNIVPVKKAEVKIAKQQIAKQGNKLMGDIIIDSRGAGTMLQNNTTISGNLYLQNMRKFTLPCNVKINGNLFLRDVNLLQFCGEFTVTGNIYVSPRSSFGPIPKTARIGGYVVL